MTVQMRRWPILAVLVSLAGCGSAVRPGEPGADARSASRGDTAVSAPATAAKIQAWRAQGWSTDFGRHSVTLSQFQDGGPPRDGIPPIDHPKPVPLAVGDGS